MRLPRPVSDFSWNWRARPGVSAEGICEEGDMFSLPFPKFPLGIQPAFPSRSLHTQPSSQSPKPPCRCSKTGWMSHGAPGDSTLKGNASSLVSLAFTAAGGNKHRHKRSTLPRTGNHLEPTPPNLPAANPAVLCESGYECSAQGLDPFDGARTGCRYRGE